MSLPPLTGIRVVEFAGLAPGPMAGMILSDFGAEVIRIDRPGTMFTPDPLCRRKRSLAVSPKTKDGRELLLKLISKADVVIDPFRPGVLERLGLGPDVIERASNGRAILCRITGFRREGKYALAAGHDINYMALSGVASLIQPPGAETPVAPLNLVADFAGGSLTAVLGIMAALIERAKSDRGQVVETDMITGVRYLSSFPLLLRRPDIGLPMWDQPVGENMLDGGAPYYANYVCADGRYMSVGAIEPHFHDQLLEILSRSLSTSFVQSHPLPSANAQSDRDEWPALRAFYTAAFASKSRDEWTSIFLGSDACVAPVLEPHEIDHRGQNAIDVESMAEAGGAPEPAPRLSRTPARSAAKVYAMTPPEDLLRPGQHTREILTEMGMSIAEIEGLIKSRTIEQADADDENQEPRAKL